MNNDYKYIINIYNKKTIRIDYLNKYFIVFFSKEEILEELSYKDLEEVLEVALDNDGTGGASYQKMTVREVIDIINN